MRTDKISWANSPDLLTVTEAAAISRVGKAQIYKLAAVKAFHVKRFGRSIRIPRDNFRNWVESSPSENGYNPNEN